MDAEFPVPIDAKVKFLDRYTVGDVVLAAAFVVCGWAITTPTGPIVGAVLGLVAAEFTPDDKRLDEQLADGIRILTGSSSVSSPQLSKIVDGSTVLENDTVIGIVEVSSCDIERLPETDQRANRDTVTEMIAGLKQPVEIHSRQRTTDLSGSPGTGTTAVTTDHYVVVRASSGSVEENHRKVTDRCTEIRNTLTAADLHAERLTRKDLQAAVNRLYFEEAELSWTGYEVEGDRRPFHRFLYVSEFPEQLPIGWIADVLNTDTPGLVDAVQTVGPISDRDRDRMDRKLARINVEERVAKRSSRRKTLEQQKQDLEDLIGIDAAGEPVVNYGVYFVAHGRTPEEAEETLNTVKSFLRQRRVDTSVPRLRLSQGVKAESPFHPDWLGETKTVPGVSAAAGFAFGAYDTVEPGGVEIGRDQRNGMPVVLDRFSWEAGHMTVMGKIGSGKSYWTGLTLLRSAEVYDDLEIYVIDPKKRDYGDIIDALGGDTVVLDDGEIDETRSRNVVRYTVEDPSRDNTEELAEAVRHVYRNAASSDSKSLVVIDEVHRIISKGNQVYQDGLQAVSTLVRESRDRNVAATLVTQNADEFTRSNEGGNILRNVDCNLFFKQKETKSEVAEFFNLSETESSELRKLRTGTELPFSEALIEGPINTRVQVDATETEHRLIENGRLNPEPEVNPGQGQTAVEAQTDGGRENGDSETRNERHGLITILNLVSRAPIRLFEAGTFTLASAGVLLTLLGAWSVSEVGVLPLQTEMDVLAGIGIGIIAVELIWIVVLTLANWLTQYTG
ncbi:helicase HerA domain-containing protein [Halostella pelagica]|uniref:helicase HerA domain-containing protein n=1 Tax=Halostella pelagica TaxID=2583824 RepID=UPI001080F80E|nr:ATP-binding protein [Halostella pelagica]